VQLTLFGATIAAAMLDPQRSRNRQKRLLDRLESRYDAIIVGQRRHVYYLSSWRGGLPTHEAAMVLFKDGGSWLITQTRLRQRRPWPRMSSLRSKRTGLERSDWSRLPRSPKR
jgi:hypothetical protein